MKHIARIIAVLFLLPPMSLGSAVGIYQVKADEIASGSASYSLSRMSSGDVIIVVNAIDCGTGATVSSVTWNSEPLTITSNAACLTTGADVDVWTCDPAATLSKTTAVTLSDSSGGESIAMTLTDVIKVTPIIGYAVSVGQGVTSEVVEHAGGEATIMVLFVFSDTITVSTPSGFASAHNQVLTTDVRVVVFTDFDGSQDTATLTFSSAVNYIAVVLGIDEDN